MIEMKSSTPFHQKIAAHELTLKRPAHELRKLSQSLASSTADRLYEQAAEYLQRPEVAAIKHSQRAFLSRRG
jgi:hypothetical protein